MKIKGNVISKAEIMNFLKSDLGVIFLFSIIKLLIHLFTNIFAGYGIFRDELYYLSCATRPDFGYVDHPPFSIWVLGLVRSIIGNSVFAIRIVSAFAGAVTVYFAGKITRELGGGKLAISISSLSIILAPIYLGMFSIYSMNSIDIMLWAAVFFLLMKILKNESDKKWIILGVLMGIGLLNKISFIWLAAGIFIGFLIYSKGKFLTKKAPWIAGVIAGLIFLPFIIWNIFHDWAHLEFIKNAQMLKYSGITRLDFVKNMFLILNPVAAFVWITGLISLLFSRRMKKFRVLGYIFITVFMILIINGKSKAEYITAAMLPLFAAGGEYFGSFGKRKSRNLVSGILIVSLIVSGVMFAPLALPVLPPELFIKYSQIIGIDQPSSENKELSELPQFYADMFGWKEMAKNVSIAYKKIPENERKNTVFWGRNYGQAAAIEYYSDKYDLPNAVSTHNNFYFWGYGNNEVKHVIFVGGNVEEFKKSFRSVTLIKIHYAKYAIPYENNRKVLLCSFPKRDIEKAWEHFKHYE